MSEHIHRGCLSAAAILLCCIVHTTHAQGLPCSSNCSDQGDCINGQCVCDDGWSGDDCSCSTVACPNDCGLHGECVCGECVCDDGWSGIDCSCTHACSNHGACLDGVCQCDPGWDGEFCECSTLPCPLDCSGNGTCECGVCTCDDGWRGVACDCVDEPCPNACSGNGVCGCSGVCVCDAGWGGPDCTVACPNLCSGRGTCTAGVCDCNRYWTGKDCSDPDYVRVFMATEDMRFETSIDRTPIVRLAPGTTETIMIWVEDTRQAYPMSGIQPIIRWTASIRPGTEGTVRYVNLPYFACGTQTDGKFGVPCEPGGAFCPNDCIMFDGRSIRIDESRQDYVFSEYNTYPPIFHENAPEDNGLPKFGLFAQHVDASSGAFLAGLHYVAEFDVEISPDATGQFRLRFVLRNTSPIALTRFFRPFGLEFEVDVFQDLIVIVAPQPLSFSPTDRSVDARQPSEPDGSDPAGISGTTWFYNADMSTHVAEDFIVEVSDGSTRTVTELLVDGGVVEMVFDDVIPPGHCARVTDLLTGANATMGHLPGDVNGDRVVTPTDLLELVDDLNGLLAPPLAPQHYDIDRSESRGPRDILRLIDLFNGAGVYDPWLGRRLANCPP